VVLGSEVVLFSGQFGFCVPSAHVVASLFGLDSGELLLLLLLESGYVEGGASARRLEPELVPVSFGAVVLLLLELVSLPRSSSFICVQAPRLASPRAAAMTIQ
jgi:hypothetical protein